MNVGAVKQRYTYYASGASISGSWHDYAAVLEEVDVPSVIYYIKVWHDYFLAHYFIPLPKGYYLPDGRQVPYNTFYDIVTNTLCNQYTPSLYT